MTFASKVIFGSPVYNPNTGEANAGAKFISSCRNDHAAFCRERGLDNTHMVAVAHGRICSHRGWTHKNGRQKSEPKVYTGFINPDGQRVIIANLRALCREHGLHPVRMHQLKNGQRKSHKGWTWREE